MDVPMGHRALVTLMLCACAHRQPMLFGERVPKGCSGDDVSVSNDRCMGWFLDRIVMLGRVEYDDRTLAAYVAGVGNNLVRASGDRRDWHFRVLDDGDPQAYASVGTTVWLTRGALARLRSEAELAALLGHEIGHVLAGHAHEDLVGLSRKIARDSADDLLATRDDEIQADALAVRLTARAGYNAKAVETMLRALAAGDPSDEPTDHHPRMLERIARVQAFAAHFSGGTLGEAPFRAHVEGLSADDDPRTITLIDQTVVFARAKLAVDVPPFNRVELESNGGTIELETGEVIDLRRISPELASMMPVQRGDHMVSVAHAVGKRALLITVAGDDAEEVAQALRKRVRAPRRDELVRVTPRVVDFGAPRRLWPD